jgi:hypothetical protein
VVREDSPLSDLIQEELSGDMSALHFSINSPDSISYGPGAMADFRVYGRTLASEEIQTGWETLP